MKRTLILLTCIAALAAASTALAGGHRAKLELRETSLGKIVTNGAGFTLYMFTRDRRNKDNCAGTRGCAGIWPLLTSSGKPIAGRGIKAKLIGTIKVGRARQVTYAGHPLYTYVGDSGPGDTSYVGFNQFGGNWYAVGPGGHAVK